VLVPLGEWSDRSDDFFDFLVRRNAFRAFRREHFMQVAYHGRLVFLLDGWNELNPTLRIRAGRDIRALQRDFPTVGFVISTRKQALPLDGVIVSIAPLSEERQLELAKVIRGSEGEAIVDQAWRTPGVRELISVPLYLQVLLAIDRSEDFPSTKDEVLQMFVTQHESAPEKADILRAAIGGFHRTMLEGLASEATKQMTAILSDDTARRVIGEVGANLVMRRQLAMAPQPNDVLDALVQSHVLVRAPQTVGISFQHQQFQEWFASFEVERVMRAAQSAGERNDALERLRVDILNWSSWEESVLFACERLSRSGTEGAEVVGAAILECLAIDPMLAAEMIFRSSAETWAMIRDGVVAFAGRWHTPGRVDRAIRFIIKTGRPDFSPIVWPLVSSSDSQIHLRALRAAERFRPTVLGEGASSRLGGLPVLAEIASNSGFDGMTLAADLATVDPNPQVVVEVVHALQFRRADRHILQILRGASDAVWKQVAASSYPETVPDKDLNARLLEERQRLFDEEKTPLQQLRILIRNDRP